MSDQKILALLEQLHLSAQTGRNFADDIHNQHRYDDILTKILKLYQYIPHFKETSILPLTAVGYVTPKIGVNAIIENEKGEILLEKRMDDKAWCLIGGWCEAGLSPEENIIKEIKEETGFDAKVNQQIHIFSRQANEKHLYSSYHILYHCEIVSGSLQVSYESEDVAFIHPDKVKDWHYDHESWVKYYFKNKNLF